MEHITVTAEQQELLETARRFRTEVIEPMRPHEREWIEDPEDRFPWDVVEAGSKLGLRTLAAPKEYGGGGASVHTLCQVVQELARGDMGIAVIFDQVYKVTHAIAGLVDQRQAEWFFPRFVEDDRYLLAAASTEAGNATNKYLSQQLTRLNGYTPKFESHAELDGDEWLINGRKVLPSLGSTAKLIVVRLGTEPGKGIHDGSSAIMVPTDTAGFGVEHVWDKLGQRLADNAIVTFDNVRVPEWFRLGARGEAFAGGTTSVLRGTNAEAAATTLGTARAAYDAALAYARERVQGGRPIIEHQLVGDMLARMSISLEAAWSLTEKAAIAMDEQRPNAAILGSQAKVFAADAAVDVCLNAMEILGGYGYMRGNPVQKYLRDCLSFLHSDGTQQMHRMRVHGYLIDAGRGSDAGPSTGPL